MIGYPNGLWDKVNGLPFFKRGMTATHPYINYNGREEFVMDISGILRLPGVSVNR